MAEPDYDLRPGPEAPPPRAPRASGPPTGWFFLIALLVAAAAAIYVFMRGRPGEPDEPAQTIPPVAEAPAPGQPLGGEPQPIDLPPLAETDPVVRRLVGTLSSHPRIAAWLATDDLIRNFVVVVENVAYGTNPAPRLQALQPAGGFGTAGEATALRVDRRSYERYNGIADAAASLDPRGTADLYATLKPRIEEAWSELGRQGSFDRALERAIAVLLDTPVVEGEVPLTPGPVGYRYASPALERLAPAQKQLLRTGPRNTRIIQERLRAIVDALGIQS